MPTVAEVLKSSGMSDEQIAALDAKVIEGFKGVLTTAESAQAEAERQARMTTKYYEETIEPALNSWGTKEANLQAERDYYKTLAEKAKDGGFVQEVPPFRPAEPARGGDGRFTQVPGSPDMAALEAKVGGALGTLADTQWKYRTLYGAELPESPTSLAAEATRNGLSMADYVARKYDFAGKEKAIAEEKQKKHDDDIRAAATTDRDKYWAERTGTHPGIRPAEPSKYTEIRQAVKSGERPDPLKLSASQRHAATRSAILKDAQNAAA